MSALLVMASVVLILTVLYDGFEAILLPRRVSRPFRIARFYYQATWYPWSFVARRMRSRKRREIFLSQFGPLSVLGLFATWAVGLIVGFGVMHASLETPMNLPAHVVPGSFDYLYFSGVTFFTLGFGDLAPVGRLGRTLAVLEAGIGFAFLAVVISYLPVLYQAFSRREAAISVLDARAGSPPTASALLIRIAPSGHFASLDRFLQEWERYSAEVLESQLSFPSLNYYRSQHDNQSWLAALTTMLDTCALVITALKGFDPYQAQLTFAMARHAAVDLAQVLQARPESPAEDRLPPDRLASLLNELELAGLQVRDPASVRPRLDDLRRMYEPFVNALATHLVLTLPPIRPGDGVVDNWQTSAWMKRTRGIGNLALADPDDDHAD